MMLWVSAPTRPSVIARVSPDAPILPESQYILPTWMAGLNGRPCWFWCAIRGPSWAATGTATRTARTANIKDERFTMLLHTFA